MRSPGHIDSAHISIGACDSPEETITPGTIYAAVILGNVGNRAHEKAGIVVDHIDAYQTMANLPANIL